MFHIGLHVSYCTIQAPRGNGSTDLWASHFWVLSTVGTGTGNKGCSKSPNVRETIRAMYGHGKAARCGVPRWDPYQCFTNKTVDEWILRPPVIGAVCVVHEQEGRGMDSLSSRDCYLHVGCCGGLCSVTNGPSIA